MPKRGRGITATTNSNRIKQGRGQGDGESYQPFVKVQDFSSYGQSNRDLGFTTGRQHDYFSKLEHRYHLILDWFGLIDIKEQFPLLPIEETVSIAHQCGIKHPAHTSTKELIVVTTDFRLTVPRPVGQIIQARAVKPSANLRERRTIEKLEIERRYWAARDIDWGVVTERDVDPILAKNLVWIYKYRPFSSLHPLSKEDVYRASNLLTEMVMQSDAPLSGIALECDDRLGMESGCGLSIARHLLASRQWQVDMTKPIQPSEKLSLIGANLSTAEIRKTGT